MCCFFCRLKADGAIRVLVEEDVQKRQLMSLSFPTVKDYCANFAPTDFKGHMPYSKKTIIHSHIKTHALVSDWHV